MGMDRETARFPCSVMVSNTLIFISNKSYKYWYFLFIAELRTRGAPLLRKYGNPSMREILVL